MSITTTTELAAALRARAQGIYHLEAGVELLIHAGSVWPGAPFLRQLGDLDGRPTMVDVDVEQLLETANTWSEGQQRVAAIAASLLDPDHPVDLSDAVRGLDRRNTSLILAAIAHANGSHEQSDLARDETGRILHPMEFRTLPSLYPWPSEDPLADI